MVEADSITHMHRISKHAGCCMSGMYADGKLIAQRAQYYSSKFEFDYGYEMPVSLLAKKVADFAQLLTQHAYMRPFGVSAMYIGWDEQYGPQLWRSDPAGSVAMFRGCASGEKEQEAFNNLEKKKIDETLNEQQVIVTALDCLQTITSSEFKPIDIEIAVVSKDNHVFRTLTLEEIERYLTLASEKD